MAILNCDQRTYGFELGVIATNSTVTAEGGESLPQQHIEDLIVTPRGATAFQGPQDVVAT